MDGFFDGRGAEWFVWPVPILPEPRERIKNSWAACGGSPLSLAHRWFFGCESFGQRFDRPKQPDAQPVIRLKVDAWRASVIGGDAPLPLDLIAAGHPVQHRAVCAPEMMRYSARRWDRHANAHTATSRERSDVSGIATS
jgi:hypothetical protein